MKSHHKIVVLGARSTGKTSILHQLIFGKFVENEATIEDIYTTVVSDVERGNAKEKVHFFDTQGLINPLNPEIIKLHLSYADAFILVYAINDLVSYNLMDQAKKLIDRLRDKKEVPIIVFGNKIDKFRDRQVMPQEWHCWVQKERVQIFEVTATERNTLLEPIRQLINKLSPQPSNKSSFPQLHRKNKAGTISLEL